MTTQKQPQTVVKGTPVALKYFVIDYSGGYVGDVDSFTNLDEVHGYVNSLIDENDWTSDDVEQYITIVEGVRVLSVHAEEKTTVTVTID